MPSSIQRALPFSESKLGLNEISTGGHCRALRQCVPSFVGFRFLPGEDATTSLLRILSLVAAKTTSVMPLILAGLLPLVSLAGVAMMRSPETVDHPASIGGATGTSIATDARGEAPISQQDDGGFGGSALGEGPQRDEEPPYANPDSEATESTPDVDGDDSGAPGKSEEAPGHPGTLGQGEGRGQENADQNGQGPADDRDNDGTKRN